MAQQTTKDGTYPEMTVIVICTRNSTGQEEYRVALVPKAELKKGLRDPDHPQLLNRKVTESLFKESKVYTHRDDAVAAGQQLTGRADTGVKVYNFEDVWPGT